jgi:hypothetical protein
MGRLCFAPVLHGYYYQPLLCARQCVGAPAILDLGHLASAFSSAFTCHSRTANLSFLQVELLLDALFAVNIYLQQKEIGPWSSYYFSEVVYISLYGRPGNVGLFDQARTTLPPAASRGFVAKTLLAWFNFGGVKFNP